MTRRHHRCRTRKDRPVSSRTATVSPLVRHGKGFGGEPHVYQQSIKLRFAQAARLSLL